MVDELCAPKFIQHLTVPRDRPGMKIFRTLMNRAFPDAHGTVDILLAVEDKVVERSSWKATHKGEFQGIPPTGKSVSWTEIHIYRLENGKIMELWSEADLLGLMIQLSHLFPSP